MNVLDVARKFHNALPAVRQWIEQTIESNKTKAVPVINLGFPRLGSVFPLDLLTKTKVVVVNGDVPFPPLSRMGIPELAQMEQMAVDMAGITYNDTFFVNRHHFTESIHFHELVHVVQWDQLGLDNYLLAYGAGIIQFGYRNSPLEDMAYRLQESFDHQNSPSGLVDLVRQETEAIWTNVAPLFTRVLQKDDAVDL